MNCPNCNSGDVYDGKCHACGNIESYDRDESDYDDKDFIDYERGDDE